MENSERLVKFLSSFAGVSRRAAGDLVKAGRVTVNGTLMENPGYQVQPQDQITLDGKPVLRENRKIYVMLNKPRGYVCTNSDPHAPQKAIDLINFKGPRLFSAGRLDKDSEGMLLFSNDGDYVATLTHPRNQILKTYTVQLTRDLSEPELAQIRAGVLDEGELLKVHALIPVGNGRYTILLNEGKKREIRRITAAVGAPTLRLKRIQTGLLKLGALPPGKWRELSSDEVALTLKNTVVKPD